jgi:hypothetical protein
MEFVLASQKTVVTKLKPGTSTKRGDVSFIRRNRSKPATIRQISGEIINSQFATKMLVKLKQMRFIEEGTRCVKRRRRKRRRVALQI